MSFKLSITRAFIGLALLLLNGLVPVYAGQALVLDIEGVIGPVTAEYVSEGLEQAEADDADFVILRMDTPGGLDAAMRDVIKEILASPLPVVGYVAPSGSRAASAGTYIMYACHVAAMSPATTLGSATPIKLGGGFPSPPSRGPDEEAGDETDSEKSEDEDKTTDAKNASERKIINDAAAFIRGLAELRGRNAEWAEKAVREAVDLTAAEALEEEVIDLVASDTDALLSQLDGRGVEVLGSETTLDTSDVELVELEPNWRVRLLSVITDPTIAYILLLLGFYGLIYELANPGAMVPGVIGAIALVLALYAFQTLPVNYAGLALLILGVGFMVLEVFMPSFGVLGIGGVIAFVIGSVILYDDESGVIGVAIPVVVTFALLSLVLLVGVVGYAVKTRRRPVVSGREEMIGAIGEALEDFDAAGPVRVHGELWTADVASPVSRGQRMRVTGMDGLRLKMEILND